MTDKVHWIVVIVFGLVLLKVIHGWIKDLLFYRQNGWDFMEPSGHKMFHGGPGYAGPELSNRNRVLFGYPLMILIFVVVICGSIFIPEQGLTWTIP